MSDQPPEHDEADRWWCEAGEELRAAEVIAGHSELPDRVAGCHAHLAAERALKSLLIRRGVAVPCPSDHRAFSARCGRCPELGVALDTSRLHNVSMVNVLVRDLPDDVHEQLQRRAERAGQSLQQYLTTELKRLVRRPTVEEVLERIEQRSGGRVGLEQASIDLADERDRR